MQLGAKETLATELEKLQEALNLSEVQRLTRKYKISSIIEQVIKFNYVESIHFMSFVKISAKTAFWSNKFISLLLCFQYVRNCFQRNTGKKVCHMLNTGSQIHFYLMVSNLQGKKAPNIISLTAKELKVFYSHGISIKFF